MYGAHLIQNAARDAGYALNVVGVPKTVDNDLPGTDRSPGYASAARYVAASVRELGMDVGTLPTPVSILETMGRDVGWLAASAACARTGSDTAPNLIYLPERPFCKQRFLSELDDVLARLGWAVVVVSEGLQDQDGEPVFLTTTDAQADQVGRMLPGGVASYLADLAARELEVRCRSEKPGLCARSSFLLTSPVDRKDAEHVGRRAVEAATDGNCGTMVALLPRKDADEPPNSCLLPLKDVAGGKRRMPDRFVNEEESFVTDQFLRYIEPLMGAQLPEYVRFI
jgi:6-phosphofructokinase 1